MSATRDMTQGKSLQVILAFTLPLLIGNVFQQLYNMVDSVVVGNFVGADALAAVGVCGSSSFLMVAICNGMASGAGDTAFSMMNGVTEVCSRIVYSQLLIRIPGLGCWSVWLTGGATWITTALVCILRYRGGKWKKKSLVTQRETEVEAQAGKAASA